jgi:hypothetical protein
MLPGRRADLVGAARGARQQGNHRDRGGGTPVTEEEGLAMSSTVQRPYVRIVAPAVLVALLAVLTAWQAGARSAEGRTAAAGDDGTTISVHGDWTVDVYAADGELVDQRAFTNALDPWGAAALAAVLSGGAEVTGWRIAFDCADAPGYDGVCWIQQADTPRGGHVFPTLEVLHENGDPGLALRGTAVAPEDFSLESVHTHLFLVDHIALFTSKELPEADQIEVMAGQSVVIRVELSFS